MNHYSPQKTPFLLRSLKGTSKSIKNNTTETSSYVVQQILSLCKNICVPPEKAIDKYTNKSFNNRLKLKYRKINIKNFK